MCLAIPAEVLSIDGELATVDLDGVQMPVSLALVDGVSPGDFVVVHVGYALTVIQPEEAEAQLALMRGAAMGDAT
ncbi:MAG: HypC/HybG/HupF family hydrogenase formation chaperone [Hyphomonas sp.]|uniref:HypC/HybG/HupF family hydrogenase formation chaperone n=1 Tax=Hyphomonas sp. TaxID=87 RepID=UPI003529449B